MESKFKIIVTVLSLNLILTCNKLNSQEKAYKQFSTNNGFPSNTIYYVLQDKLNYFWFATNKGLVCFDGYNFKSFNTSDGLADNDIFTICEDTQGTLWFPGYNGDVTYKKDQRFYNKKNSKLLSKINTNYIGLSVKTDKYNNIYYITQKEITKIDIQNQKTTKIKNDVNVSFSSLFNSPTGELFSLSYDTKNVYITNLTKNRVFSFSHKDKMAMPRLNSKGFTIGTTFYYNVKNSLIRVGLKDKNFINFKTFPEEILTINYCSQNELWVGTENGLYKIDNTSGKIISHWFKGSSVTHVLKDRESNLWITTLNKGVYLISNYNITYYNQDNGLSFNNSTFLKKIDTLLLIGSTDFMFDFISKNQIKTIKGKKINGVGTIKDFKKDSLNNYYVLTPVSLTVLDQNLNIKLSKNINAKNIIIKKDTLYFGGGGGVSAIRLSDLNLPDKKLDELVYNNKFYFKHTNFLLSSNHNLLSIGNSGINLIKGTIQKYIKTDSLFTKNITDAVFINDSNYIISSSFAGIKYCNGSQITYINNSNGLVSNFVSAICLDNKSNIWIATNKGVSKLSFKNENNRTTYQITNYTHFNKILYPYINDIEFFEDKIWLACENGTYSFTEENLINKNPMPVLNIEEINIGKDLFRSYKNTIKSKPGSNSVLIKYVAISSSLLDNITYEYRTLGIDDVWKKTNQKEIFYAKIPPGEYTFELRAINPFGKKTEIKKISIEITPRYYETGWFKLLLISVFVIIIIVIIRYRLKVIKKNQLIKEVLLESENKRLALEKEEIQLQNKLLELEQKALRLHMNPHFIFNAINAIHGFYSSGESENGKRYITKFSQLLRLLLENSANKLISLNTEIEIIQNYCALNELRFSGKYEYNITIDNTVPRNKVLIPPMILQPFIENALIHGIAPSKTKGILRINISKYENYLVCEITDNGIGRAKSKEINSKKLYSSTGINVTTERILANFTPKKDLSGITITDLYDNNNEPCGTSVKLYLDLQFSE